MQGFDRSLENHLIRRQVLKKEVVDRPLDLPLIDPQPSGGIGLGIEIHEKNLDSLEGQRTGKVDRGGCLSDAPLLVANGNDSGGVFHVEQWLLSGRRASDEELLAAHKHRVDDPV